MLKWYITIILLLNTTNNLYTLKEPEPPKDPSVDFNFNDPNIKAFPVEIICKDRNKINGNIYLRIMNISFTYQGEKVRVKIEDIKSVEFLEWIENADKKNIFIFYPSKILLILKNGQQYIIERIPEFNKIEFSGNGKKMNLYAYFYDYWEKGKWRNFNTDDKAYPTKNPLPGTLLKIVFKENNNSINKFIKVITQ